MNCDECLDLMLEADPATLTGRGEGGLAEHFRSCLTCRRTAAAIVRDTHLLAAVVERRRPAWRGPAVVAGLAAAGLLLAIGLSARNRDTPHAVAAAPRAVPPSATIPRTDSSMQVAARPNEVQVPTQAASSDRAPRVARKPIRAVAYQPAAFVATPIRVTADASEPAPMVSVRPPSGRRAAVFHTPSSGVTIVWLY
jgi:hypothetical protein